MGQDGWRFGNALAKVMVEPGANPLVKELATYFSTSEARSGQRGREKATLAEVSNALGS
jgi:hypothetical protein